MRFEIGRTEVAFCPHCGNKAPQKLVCIQPYQDIWYDPKSGGIINDEIMPESVYLIATCQTCGQILIYTEHEFAPVQKFTDASLRWPKSGLHKSVPEPISNCYAEAERIKNIAPNAFAVQIRKALEALCEDRKAEGGTLQAKLKALVKKGEIPETLANMTDALRVLGNSAAHSIDEGIKPIQVLSIDDFFNAIVEYVYVAPSKLADFKKRTSNE